MRIDTEALIRLRINKPMTRAELARSADVTEEAIRLIETGRTQHPKPSTIRGIAAGLGVKVSSFAVPVERAS